MPAPLTADWQAVQDTAVAIGSIKLAAQKHGVSVDAAHQRAKREAWPVGRRVIVQAQQAKERAIRAVSRANPSAVSHVSPAATAIAEHLAEHRGRSSASAARLVTSALERREQADEPIPIDTAADLASLVKSWATIHQVSSQDTAPMVSINLLSL